MAKRVEGIDYTPAGIELLRQELIKMRDATMSNWPGSIHDTLVLSHVIVLLAELKVMTEARDGGA